MKLEKENKLIEKQFSDIAKTIIQNKSNDNFYHKLTFNTNQLIDHENYKIYPNSSAVLVDQFKPLNIIKENHCLYWFELENKEKALTLNGLIDDYRELNIKTVPATNKNDNSHILYVGIRQGGARANKKDKDGNIILGLTNIVGRINQHLGYYHSKSTQGLQLYEYAKGKDFNITIKVIEFEGLDSKYLNTIEKLVAKEFEPLCGRH